MNVFFPLTCLLFSISCIYSSTEITFTGKRYLQYQVHKSIYEPDSISRIDLRFRTIHPSGILVLMVGKYDGTLTLQLIQGKLRYGVAHRSSDISEIILGSNLNDNEWHEVKVLRSGRVNEITLDKESKTLLSPRTFESLSVSNLFYIGGLNQFKVQNLKNVNSYTLKFIGCLEIRQIDNRDPVTYYQKGNQRVKAVPPGPIIFGCQIKQDDTFSFNTPQSKMTIMLKQASNQTLLSLRLSLRTFNSFGRIATTPTSTCYTTVEINKGRVYVELREIIGKVLGRVESRLTINDGRWHDISVALNDNDMFLRIDSEMRQTKSLHQVSSFCTHTSVFEFGGKSDENKANFVGCMRKISFNNVEMNVYDNPSYTLLKTAVDRHCKISNKCYPNPCRNAAICSQTWNSYECDCTRTSFYGKTCQTSIYKPSCFSYQRLGLTKTSYCLVDSDGNGDTQPYTTLCEFNNDSEVFTTVKHNKENEFSATDGDDKLQLYTFHKFHYKMSMNKIESLIQHSKYCQQKVTFKCFQTSFLNAPDGPAKVGWRSRNGELKHYWGGSDDDTKGCACGINKTCVEKDKLCNCDSAKITRWLSDGGYLQDKSHLPITRLDVSGVPKGRGHFTIGPLECFGSVDAGKISEQIMNVPADLLQRVCISTNKKKELVKTANESKNLVDLKPDALPEENTNHMSDRPITTQVSLQTDSNYNVIKSNANMKPKKKQKKSEPVLSTLEIGLIVVACLAIVILVIKFVICNIFGRLYGQVVLNGDENKKSNTCRPIVSATTCTLTSTLPASESGTPKKKKGKGPLNTYWV